MMVNELSSYRQMKLTSIVVFFRPCAINKLIWMVPTVFPLCVPNSLILNILYADTKVVLEMFWTSSHIEDQSEIL